MREKLRGDGIVRFENPACGCDDGCVFLWVSSKLHFNEAFHRRWLEEEEELWSLRAFASMREVLLFLEARAEINFLMQAASSEHFSNYKQPLAPFFSLFLHITHSPNTFFPFSWYTPCCYPLWEQQHPHVQFHIASTWLQSHVINAWRQIFPFWR